MAAILASGPGAVLSHRSAADLLDLRASHRAAIDVMTATHRRVAGVEIHRSRTLNPADTTIVDGIPCTNVARTLLDLAGVVSRDRVDRALEQAEAMNVLNVRALTDQLRRNPTSAGVANLRHALDDHAPGVAPAESVMEERFLALCAAARLPAPERQVHLDLGDGDAPLRADFVWSRHRLIVETDGRRFHGTRRAFEHDRRRDQRLLRAGWRVIRLTWRQLHDEPGTVIDLLTGLLAEG